MNDFQQRWQSLPVKLLPNTYLFLAEVPIESVNGYQEQHSPAP
jgi:hypothetical protein